MRLDVDLGPDVSLGSPAGAGEINSPDGTRLVYVSQGRLFTRRLDQPKAVELAGIKGASAPFFSPDGQRLALGDATDIWVYEAHRDTMMHLTSGGLNSQPVWSPDGRYSVFSGPGGIWWVRSDGASKPQPLIQTKNRLLPNSFTPDGKRLAYDEIDSKADIWTATVESDGRGLRAGKPESFLPTVADERHPTFSPDGHWLAYASNESGDFQVYVRAFPDSGGKWQISNSGGANPLWSGSGHELFFRGGDNRIMAAAYAAKADAFVPDKARVWSDKQVGYLGNGLN